ncbi:hypothetical protein KP509_18G074400 [Ceratopteris richardii]|nr:hypothetical protein KP509_18G074400 [Ceratopteris richardii]
MEDNSLLVTNTDDLSDQNMDDLPDHLLWIIFSRLTVASDLNSISQVSKRFYELERRCRNSLKVKCGLHPVDLALSSLCSRFINLRKVEIDYAGWVAKYGKQLDDNGLKIIASLCPDLQEVGLRFCTFITDVGLGHLASCKGLQAVRFNFVPSITGCGLLSIVTGCKNLSVMHLTLCLHVNSAEWLYFLGRLQNIEDLAIRQCKGISESDLARLGQAWCRLRRFQFQVDVNHRYMKTYGLLGLNGWPDQDVDCEMLEELKLINCLINPNRGLGCILPKCKHLVRLHLDMCMGLRDRDLVHLAMSSTGLKYLSLRCPSDFSLSVPANYSPQLSDESLKAIAKYCIILEEVSISFADGCYPFVPCFSLEGILALVEGCHMLKALVLDRVYAFNDYGMEALCVAHALERLELIQCPEVSDDGMQLIRHLPSLKHVRVSKCLGISDEGLAAFMGSDKLESLKIEDCPKISEKGTQGLAKMVQFRCDLSWLY